MNRLRADTPAAKLSILLVVAGLRGLTGCAPASLTGPATSTDPPLPFTVAPPTVAAWQHGPVSTRLQAAIGAQRLLFHLYFVQPPQVIFVERLDSPEAQRWLRTTPVFPPTTDGWLVILEGDFQTIGPPTPAITPMGTPMPFVHRCVYVMLAAADGASYGYGPTSCS